jgi:DNA-binding response OmpR family regulator
MQAESLGQETAVQAAGKQRILIVDDNDDVAQSLALFFRVHDHEVRVAHDGPAALAEAQTWMPEVVVLDLHLPGGMDGYEIARRLRCCCTTSGRPLRLVALSDCGQEDDRQRGREAGFDFYLVKPAEVEDLALALYGCPE